MSEVIILTEKGYQKMWLTETGRRNLEEGRPVSSRSIGMIQWMSWANIEEYLAFLVERIDERAPEYANLSDADLRELRDRLTHPKVKEAARRTIRTRT